MNMYIGETIEKLITSRTDTETKDEKQVRDQDDIKLQEKQAMFSLINDANKDI